MSIQLFKRAKAFFSPKKKQSFMEASETLDKKIVDSTMKKLFAFYERMHLKPFDSFDVYVSAAKSVLGQINENDRKVVKHMKFNEKGVMEGIPKEIHSKDYKTHFGFIIFIATIKGELTGHSIMLKNYEGMVRQEVPPLEVYKFVGHNELDIEHSKRGYSYLFD